MTRTNVVLDETLVATCKRLTGIATQRALIDHALREIVRHGRQKSILALKGRVAWQGDLRAWRKGRGAP